MSPTPRGNPGSTLIQGQYFLPGTYQVYNKHNDSDRSQTTEVFFLFFPGQSPARKAAAPDHLRWGYEREKRNKQTNTSAFFWAP